MSNDYPTSIVDFNIFRVSTLDSVDTATSRVYALCMPEDMAFLVFGMMSLLEDVNIWKKSGTLTEEQMVDFAVNDICVQAFCEAVATCLNNAVVGESEGGVGVIDLEMLRDFGSGSGNGYITPYLAADSAKNLISPDASCTNDNEFGMCKYFIDQFSFLVDDAFDKIQALLNRVQQVTDVLNEIPALEKWISKTPTVNVAFTAVDFVETLIDETMTQWDVANSQTIRNNIACDLFCEIKDTCELSLDDIINVLGQNVSDLWNFEGGITGMLQWFFQFDYGAEVDKGIVSGIMLFWCLVLQHGGKIFDMSAVGSIETILALGADETDSDWTILCSSCNQSVWNYDHSFTGGWDIWASRVGGSSVLSGGAVISSGAGTSFKEAGIGANVTLGTSVITEITVYFETDTPKDVWTWRLEADGTNYDVPSGTGSQSFSVTGLNITGNAYLAFFLHWAFALPNNNGRITRVVMNGTGSDPFP